MSSRKLSAGAELELLQGEAFSYFLSETKPVNGLVIDKTAANWPPSIATTGLSLAAYPGGIEYGFMPHGAAAERTVTTLRLFPEQPARLRTRRDRLSWLLLSFSRHAVEELASCSASNTNPL